MAVAPTPTYDDTEMAQFVRQRPQPYVINGYGHNLLEMGTETLNSTFSASFMNVMDQDYLAAVAESSAIQESMSTNVRVYDVFEESLKAIEAEGKGPPVAPWVENDDAFQQVMVQRVRDDFVETFSKEKRLNPESKMMFVECLKEFGPKSFGMLNEKLGQLQDRKGALSGLMDEIADAFDGNRARIHQRWGLNSAEEIMAIGFAEGLPPGIDLRDSVQLGRLIVDALRNPEFSKIDMLSVDGAVKFRDQHVRDVAAQNTANFGNPQLGALQSDPNGRFAPPAQTKSNTELGDDNDPNNPNSRNRSRPMMPGMMG